MRSPRPWDSSAPADRHPLLACLAAVSAMLAIALGTLAAANSVAGVWTLLVACAGVAASWKLYRSVAAPALEAWKVQLLASGEAEGPRDSRFGELYPHGNPATRRAWARRHLWLASIWSTLGGLLFVVPLCLLLPFPARVAFVAAYLVFMPFVYRVGLAREFQRMPGASHADHPPRPG